jgi:hypothetical protein
MADLEECLHEAYGVLANADLEAERLKGEIGEVSKLTIKLAHWRDVHLKSADMIIKDIERLSSTGDVNIDRLLATLHARQAELDEINADSAIFNEELEFTVHEPMRRTDEALCAIRRVIAEKIALRRSVAEFEGNAYRQTMEECVAVNEAMREENDELRLRIKQLEWQMHGSEHVRGIDIMLPRTTPRLRLSPRVRKPQVSKSRKPKSGRPLYLNL